MKKLTGYFATLICVIAFLSCQGHRYGNLLSDRADTLMQVSTIDALLDGVYDGDVSYGEIKKFGDFGIGTFNALDGEIDDSF